MTDIIEDLCPLNRVMCGAGYDKAIEYLRAVLPMALLEYPASEEHNGWVIPPRWEVSEATISRNGAVIYDGKRHPLGVIALSAPYSGSVSRETLRQHLHYDHRFPDSLTFHFRQQYRAWERDWGFCVPRDLYDSLEPGDYDVRIVTQEAPGSLKLLVGSHPGSLPYSLALCANLDHPGVANDGLAGVAVGVEILRRLQGRKTKLSYQLLLGPGIMGTEYYLAGLMPLTRQLILECLCLWMLGSRTPLALQESRGSQSNVEEALAEAMDERGTAYRRGEFESIIINDEYVWEAYGIPTCSLSRFPYPEYHSSRDNMSIISEASLGEAAESVMGAIDLLEATLLVERRFEGTICLSNPRYDLYVDPGQASFGEKIGEQQQRLRMLQDFLPSLTRPTTARSLARRFALPEATVVGYLRKWQEKGLLSLSE